MKVFVIQNNLKQGKLKSNILFVLIRASFEIETICLKLDISEGFELDL